MNPIARSSEHAIRALTFLAQQAGGERYVLAREIAEHLDVPAAFLGKILQSLVARGILESHRGRHGGFRLGDEPRAITLYRIVDAQEVISARRVCFLGQADCSDDRACPMHDYWKRTSHEFEERLQRTTLADIVAFCESNPGSGYPCPRPARLTE